jgi:FkbM family methyltransferase
MVVLRRNIRIFLVMLFAGVFSYFVITEMMLACASKTCTKNCPDTTTNICPNVTICPPCITPPMRDCPLAESPKCPACPALPSCPSCPTSTNTNTNQKCKDENDGVIDVTNLIFTPTTTNPPFVFVNLNKGVVSNNINQFGSFAPTETVIFRTILLGRCNETSKGELVIDIGGNLGYFTTYSAKMGCRVQSYEPVPSPRRFINLNTKVNGVKNLVEVFPYAVSDVKTKIKIWVYEDDLGVSKVSNEGNLEVETAIINDIVKEDALIVKVDVEGHEMMALHDIVAVTKNFKVENLIAETSKPNKELQDRNRKIINNMILNDYLVISYYEEYFTPNHWKEINQIYCTYVNYLQDKDWIPYGDLWYIKKGSKTHEKIKDKLACKIS